MVLQLFVTDGNVKESLGLIQVGFYFLLLLLIFFYYLLSQVFTLSTAQSSDMEGVEEFTTEEDQELVDRSRLLLVCPVFTDFLPQRSKSSLRIHFPAHYPRKLRQEVPRTSFMSFLQVTYY